MCKMFKVKRHFITSKIVIIIFMDIVYFPLAKYADGIYV